MDVTLITVNFHGEQDTYELMDSLQKHKTNLSYQVIVVDNGSKHSDCAAIADDYSFVKYIKSQENLGFAGGNNLALPFIEGKHVLFINNDTLVSDFFMDGMFQLLESDLNIGLVSPKIIYYHTDNLIQYAGANPINLTTGRGSKIGHLAPDNGDYDDVRPTALGHGAAMMVPHKVVKEVGGIPEEYFLYYEEHDWTQMIIRAGYKVYYCGTCKIYHKESASTRKISGLKMYYLTRNRLLYVRRNAKGLQKWVAYCFFGLFSLPKAVLLMVIRRDWALLRAFFKGVLWNINYKNYSYVNKNPKIAI